MNEKFKPINAIIDLAAKVHRKNNIKEKEKLDNAIDEIMGDDFILLAQVYDFGLARGVSSTISIIERHKQQQEGLHLLSENESSSLIRTKMKLDNLLEVNLVRGLGLMSKAGLGDTGVTMR